MHSHVQHIKFNKNVGKKIVRIIEKTTKNNKHKGNIKNEIEKQFWQIFCNRWLVSEATFAVDNSEMAKSDISGTTHWNCSPVKTMNYTSLHECECLENKCEKNVTLNICWTQKLSHRIYRKSQTQKWSSGQYTKAPSKTVGICYLFQSTTNKVHIQLTVAWANSASHPFFFAHFTTSMTIVLK